MNPSPQQEPQHSAPGGQGSRQKRPSIGAILWLTFLLAVLLLLSWFRLMRLWRDVPYYAHYVYLIVGCVLLISEFVKRTRQKPQDEWSPEPELLRHQIIGAWYLFAFVVMLFLSGLGLLLVGSLQERIVGGAISVVIGFGYFKLRAIERRKSRMRPSPFFYWL